MEKVKQNLIQQLNENTSILENRQRQQHLLKCELERLEFDIKNDTDYISELHEVLKKIHE